MLWSIEILAKFILKKKKNKFKFLQYLVKNGG